MDESQAISINGDPFLRLSQEIKTKAIRSKEKQRGIGVLHTEAMRLRGGDSCTSTRESASCSVRDSTSPPIAGVAEAALERAADRDSTSL